MNIKVHATCDGQGRPLDLFATAGGASDDIGARALPGSLPDVEWLLGDRGHDANRSRDALKVKAIGSRIPGRMQRKVLMRHDKRR